MGWLQEVLGTEPVERWDSKAQTEEFRRERKRLSENHYLRAQALTAWLLATLVAVNGAGLAIQQNSPAQKTSFAVGVILAILSGFASWQVSQDRNGLHYVESLAPENVTAYGLRREKTWRRRWPVVNLLAKLLNHASLLAFITGCVLMAWA
jgi:hypothetical protein